MRYIIHDNTIVLNIIVADNPITPPDGSYCVEAKNGWENAFIGQAIIDGLPKTPQPSKYHTWDDINSLWVYTDGAGHIEDRCDEVDALEESKYTTLTYGGSLWQIDRKSQISINNRALYADLCLTDGAGPAWSGDYLYWRDANNNDIEFTLPADFIAFAQSVSDYCAGIYKQACAHKDALRSMIDPTYDDVNNYDITTGW